MGNLSGTKKASELLKSREKARDSNLELYRIITMIMIVAHHYVVNSGLTSADGPVCSAPMGSQSLFLLVFGAWGLIGINCFVLITGYFMCTSNITLKKVTKLLLEFLFYQWVIYLVFLVSGYSSFSVKELIKAILPITRINKHFVGCFILLLLCIPFLNRLLHQLNERQHLRLIALCSFVYILFGTFKQVTMNYFSWFIVLYVIASYLRLRPHKIFDNTKIWGVLTIVSVLLSVASIFCLAWVGAKKNSFMPYYLVSDSNTLLAVEVGVCSFLFFKNLKMKRSRIINTLAASTFGVLCIHAISDTMRQWLWKDTLDVVGHYGSSLMPIYSIVCVLGVFFICIGIDMVRKYLIERPFFLWLDNHQDGWVKKYAIIEEKVFRKLNIR